MPKDSLYKSWWPIFRPQTFVSPLTLQVGDMTQAPRERSWSPWCDDVTLCAVISKLAPQPLHNIAVAPLGMKIRKQGSQDHSPKIIPNQSHSSLPPAVSVLCAAVCCQALAGRGGTGEMVTNNANTTMCDSYEDLEIKKKCYMAINICPRPIESKT